METLKKINLNTITPDNIKQKKKVQKVLLLVGLPILGVVIAFLIVLILAMVLAMPLMADSKKVSSLAQETIQAAKNQDLVLAEQKIKETHQATVNLKNGYKRLIWVKFVPFISHYYYDGENGLQAAESGVTAGQILIEALTPYADVLGLKGKGTFTGGTAQDRIIKIIQTIGEVAPKMGEVQNNIILAQQSLKKIDPYRYPETLGGKEIRSNIIKAQALADQAAQGIAEAIPALEVLPKFLGYPEAQKYLFLMQNDGELRATGGFMTAYAIIKVENGKITPEKSDDIYSLDKKNTNKVKAPDAIVKYLLNADLNTGIVPYWYLRDMNLSPDFKTSMETFRQYYDKLPNESNTDGIIAIDTKFLQDLLTMVGDIEVEGWGKFTMEKDSRCHDIPQIICELEYLVGSPSPTMKEDRKAILGPLMKTILNKVLDAPSSLGPSIFKVGLQDIQEKHLLMYFTDEKMQHAAEVLNAAGRIKQGTMDYLHINDTNFGGAKSNLFTQHQVEQKITVKDDNKIENVLTLTYSNPEPMDNCNLERTKGLCLNGILRNYLRVYVPKGSKLIEAVGSEAEVKTYDELDHTVFEGFFTVRGGGGRAKVVITYELPFSFDKQKGYDLLIQKQPGTIGHKYSVLFNEQKEEFELKTDKELHFSE